MKIKSESGTIDESLNLLGDLLSSGVITDKDNQLVEVDDNFIALKDVLPSDKLGEIVGKYPGYKIFTGPNETDPFKPEPGLSDEDKIGTVTVQEYKEDTDESLDLVLNEISLFPEDELSEEDNGSGNDNINFNSDSEMKDRKNFNDPNLDPNGVAEETNQAPVVAEETAALKNQDPNGGSFSSIEGIQTFSDEEIERAGNLEVEITPEGEVKLFTDEEIEAMEDPEKAEKALEEAEREEKAFNEKKLRLYKAKRAIKRFTQRAKTRRTFSDELEPDEKDEVIQDITEILNECPEIASEVKQNVEVFAETPAEVISHEVAEVNKQDVNKPEPQVDNSNPEHPETQPELQDRVDAEIKAFSEEEIEAAIDDEEGNPENEVVVDEEEIDPEIEAYCERAGFSAKELRKSFSVAPVEDTVALTKSEELARLREKQSSFGRPRR